MPVKVLNFILSLLIMRAFHGISVFFSIIDEKCSAIYRFSSRKGPKIDFHFHVPQVSAFQSKNKEKKFTGGICSVRLRQVSRLDRVRLGQV